MIDQYFLFAMAAVVLALARYGTYFYTIFKGETKPHAFSWLLWGSVTGIGALAQFDLNAGPAAWALAFVSISCFCIAIIAFFIGEKDYTRSDWMALTACIIAIPIWQITNNPLYALAIVILIDALTYYPTFRKTYHKPQSEPPISYFFAGLRYFLMLFAIPEPTLQNLSYPFFLMITDWGFAIFVVIRRLQLGYPIHEYAKPKSDRYRED